MYLNKRIIILMVIGMIITYVWACKDTQDDVNIIDDKFVSSNEFTSRDNTECIYVYIVGEVVNPGVYQVEYGSRVCDVVDLAGGMTENAAIDFINLASKVSDGEKITIYSVEQINNQVIIESISSLVNINTADAKTLMTLPGIGESRANDIIKYREKNGYFETIEDIMKVSGIKEAAFSKIEDLITVN